MDCHTHPPISYRQSREGTVPTARTVAGSMVTKVDIILLPFVIAGLILFATVYILLFAGQDESMFTQ